MVAYALSIISTIVTGPLSLLALIAFGGVAYCILCAALDPQRRVPGPFLARFTRWWYFSHIHKGQAEIDEIKLHEKYGPVVRLAPNMYSFSDLSAAKTIYDHGTKYPKSDFYSIFGVPLKENKSVFQEQRIHVHAIKRRNIASMFSMSSIVSYEPFVTESIQVFLDQFDRFAMKSEPVDLPAWLQFYAFDVIGAITIGRPYGFLEQGHDFPGIIQEMEGNRTNNIHIGVFNPKLHPYIAMLIAKLPWTPPLSASYSYAAKTLAKKRQDLEEGTGRPDKPVVKQDLAEKLMAQKSRDKMSDEDILNAVQSNVAAGSDTTGITLSAIMYYLMRNPSSMSKLRDEVDQHKSNPRPQPQPEEQQDKNENENDNDRGITTFAQAQEMPYLQAVIKEALRIHPAVGMQLPRVVPEGGATLSNHFFPAGSVVGVNAWVMHRQASLFGADADQFRPERWLEGDLKSRELDRALYTFGAGSRTCLGRHISLLEMQKLVPELVSRYDFSLVDHEGAHGAEWECLNRFFVKQKYQVQVKRRSV